MDFFSNKKGLAVSGLIFGLGLALLAFFGNPANMAMCAACFIRDTAGALKLHSAAVVQYYRPEIVGLVVGSFLIALATREFRSTAGSSPMTRFVLGFIMMLGALVFLGCPLRMVIRMAAGDLNAWVGLVGFALGVATGAAFLAKGFSLGREHDTNPMAGAVLPVLLAIGLVISVATTAFMVSETGPGSKHAPWIVAFAVALVLGALAQKSRICFAGGLRNALLARSFEMLLPIAGLFVVMLAYNLITGGFKLSFDGQPIAHSQHLWNILGLYAVGLAAVLAGGCPLRQMILAGQGSCDGAVTFVGMLVGAAVAHNFGLASAATAAATETSPAVIGGPAAAGQIVLVCSIAVLLIIGFANIKKRQAAVATQPAAQAE